MLLFFVSPALSLMLTLGGVLVPPDGCAVVAVEEDGRAFAACADDLIWLVFEPEVTHDGQWSITCAEPSELAGPRPSTNQPEPDVESAFRRASSGGATGQP
jgi:hypothetical protein